MREGEERMVQAVVAGIAHALRGAFGEDIPIYADRVEQGLRPPCFSVNLLSREEKRMPGRRVRHLLPFEVLFFPALAQKKIEIWETERRMREALALIPVEDGFLRGGRIKSEQADGVLRVRADYSFFSLAPDDTQRMRECSGVLLVKGEGDGEENEPGGAL